MNVKFLSAYLLVLCSIVALAQSETRSLESFSRLSVSEAITVEIRSGNKEEAVIEVRGADPDAVITDVSGNRLDIEMRDRRGGWRNVDVKVTLTYKQLDEISVSSAADLVTLDPIVGERLEVEVSSAGDAEIEVQVDRLEARVSSSGDIRISGRATRQEVRVSSSGDYSGFDLESEEAYVDASSAGDIEVYVTKVLDGTATSAGEVTYRGNPDKVYADSSSGGSIGKY